MTTHRQNIWFASWLVMASATAFLPAGAQELPPADLPPGVEILGRGPIHEAFAEPILFDDTPALIAPRQPPQMVRELPPENQPAGDSVIWIPGYWSWDEERNDFIWVSGIWRQAPPGRRWLPGYWTAVENGYRWWPGSWIEEAQRDIAYLPAPPDSLEIGPASPPPGDEFAWIPGCWQWIDEEQAYVWQPGSWQILPDAFVWVPGTTATRRKVRCLLAPTETIPLSTRNHVRSGLVRTGHPRRPDVRLLSEFPINTHPNFIVLVCATQIVPLLFWRLFQSPVPPPWLLSVPHLQCRVSRI